MKIFCFLTFLFATNVMALPCPNQDNAELSGPCQSLREYLCSGKTGNSAPLSEDEYQASLLKLRTPEFSARILGHVKAAIEAESTLPQEQREKLSKIAQDIHIVFVKEDAKALGLSEKALEFLGNVRILACSFNGNMPNASAIYIENHRMILVCPGTIKKIISAQQSANEMADAMTFILAHETGHFLFNDYQELYQKYKDCLIDHPTHEKLEREKTANIFKILFRELRVGPHLNEIAADYWGNRAVAQMMKTNQKPEIFRGNYNFLCLLGNSDDGQHPGLDYRLNFLTRSDPDITRALQCTPQPGCHL